MEAEEEELKAQLGVLEPQFEAFRGISMDVSKADRLLPTILGAIAKVFCEVQMRHSLTDAVSQRVLPALSAVVPEGQLGEAGN